MYREVLLSSLCGYLVSLALVSVIYVLQIRWFSGNALMFPIVAFVAAVGSLFGAAIWLLPVGMRWRVDSALDQMMLMSGVGLLLGFALTAVMTMPLRSNVSDVDNMSLLYELAGASNASAATACLIAVCRHRTSRKS